MDPVEAEAQLQEEPSASGVVRIHEGYHLPSRRQADADADPTKNLFTCPSGDPLPAILREKPNGHFNRIFDWTLAKTARTKKLIGGLIGNGIDAATVLFVFLAKRVELAERCVFAGTPSEPAGDVRVQKESEIGVAVACCEMSEPDDHAT